jgi:class 3 adenylate cyclase
MNAWVETPNGDRVAIDANCYFGRSHANTVHLHSPGASRRHAHIHAQQAESGLEYWIADLGSSNGTLCNGKRVTLPHRLKDGDIINILDDNFVFHVEKMAPNPAVDTESPPTVVMRASPLCWLLMIDIKRYTMLSRQLDTDTLGVKIGTWLRQCRDAIESSGGVVDKFLGDAIFAYWKNNPGSSSQVSNALKQLSQFQQARDPDFRIVLHHGSATLAGSAGGADNLSGPEVIYTFRMEKVCSVLQTDSILSENARKALAADCACEPLGQHRLDGFPGTYAMYRLAD